MSARSNDRGRRVRRDKSGQVLILLLGALFLGGSSAVTVGILAAGRSIDDLKKETKELVTDKAARQRADALYEHWKKSVDAYSKHREQQGKKLLELIGRHDAQRADYDALIGEFDRQNQQAWNDVVQVLMSLRAEVPAEQWSKLFPPPAAKRD